ncbi:hypothetical protein K469DRAFT_210277 [Zopfia rhizophila CBS 207.26]|uniref:Uncharacterized protein n=1 Tax=Zopfia rhizophila CBS 207.26 TaxID=1314779 RepID=A0A6A6DYD7_9PEZI|nr:hypothetical protein K469DRAFT_210277 [Zopfia rhizophila CBS 207.26]
MEIDNEGSSGAGDVKEALKQLDGEPDRTLGDAKFIIGDYVSCPIFLLCQTVALRRRLHRRLDRGGAHRAMGTACGGGRMDSADEATLAIEEAGVDDTTIGGAAAVYRRVNGDKARHRQSGKEDTGVEAADGGGDAGGGRLSFGKRFVLKSC